MKILDHDKEILETHEWLINVQNLLKLDCKAEQKQ